MGLGWVGSNGRFEWLEQLQHTTTGTDENSNRMPDSKELALHAAKAWLGIPVCVRPYSSRISMKTFQTAAADDESLSDVSCISDGKMAKDKFLCFTH